MDKQVILITGCSSGFGRDAALTLARKGNRVYATMRDVAGKNAAAAAELHEIAQEEQLDVDAIDLDVTSDESVQRAVDHILADTGRIDVVINNAGTMYIGIVEAFTSQQLRDQLETNVVGPHRVNRAVLPGMREQRSGLIIQVTSVGGRTAHPYSGVYNASKWALEALSEGQRYELTEHGIDMVIVEPGPFTTMLFEKSTTGADTDRAEAYPELGAAWDTMQGSFDAMFSDPEAPVDPQLVVDAIVELIETPAGERPLRTVVGNDFDAARAINELTHPYRYKALAALGMEHFAGAGKTAPSTS